MNNLIESIFIYRVLLLIIYLFELCHQLYSIKDYSIYEAYCTSSRKPYNLQYMGFLNKLNGK